MSCKEGSLEPCGQQGRQSPQFRRAESPVADAKGDQRGAATLGFGAQLSQQWSGACLSCTFKVVSSTLLHLFDKCVGTPDAKWGICPGVFLWVVPLCRHGCSGILSVFPCQKCLL